jgi:hypothetical protein
LLGYVLLYNAASAAEWLRAATAVEVCDARDDEVSSSADLIKKPPHKSEAVDFSINY